MYDGLFGFHNVLNSEKLYKKNLSGLFSLGASQHPDAVSGRSWLELSTRSGAQIPHFLFFSLKNVFFIIIHSKL